MEDRKSRQAEVEEALLSHQDVAEAAVFSVFCIGALVRTSPRPSYSVQRPQLTAQKLRDFARERLARFKVPGLIRIVPEIPKGPVGKIKRRALARALSITSSRARAERRAEVVAPRSKLESQLAKMWADLLEVDRIGIDQDVFALGADSLTVTQMLSRLRAHFSVEFKDIFDAPTIAELATRLNQTKKVPVVQHYTCVIRRRMTSTSRYPFSNKESMSSADLI